MGPYRPLEDAAESEDPDGAPEPSDIPPRDLGQLIAESVSTYAKAFLPLFAIALIPQIPNILGAALGFGDSFDYGASVSFNSGDLLLPLIAFPAQPSRPGPRPSSASDRVLTGRKADIVTCYSRAFGVLLPTAVVTVIVTVALVASAILMLILIGIPLFLLPVGDLVLRASRRRHRGQGWNIRPQTEPGADPRKLVEAVRHRGRLHTAPPLPQRYRWGSCWS